MFGLTVRDPLSDILSNMMFPSPYTVDETDDEISLNCELPGIKQDEIAVSLENGILTIRANSKDRTFYNAWTLPDWIDVERVVAQYEDGVLTMTLPKQELAKLRRIEVTAKKHIAAEKHLTGKHPTEKRIAQKAAA